MPDINEEYYNKMAGDTKIGSKTPEQCPPLVLAYMGDAVYEVFIRTLIVGRENLPVHMLHEHSVKFVKAKAQSNIIHGIMEILTPEEQDIVRRGRNARSGTIPKNADITEYKRATGFEALLGYLYLKRDFGRLIEIMKAATEIVDGKLK